MVTKTLQALDRWEVHSAERLIVSLAGLRLAVVQQPTSLTARRVGVGACLWDGALVLAGYLAAQPQYSYVGCRAVELGAGVGLVGLALAKMGAQAVITDIEKVLPLLNDNLVANGFPPEHRPPEGRGWAAAAELEWGRPGWMRTVRRLADPPPDLVLAADCCYIDNDGASPSTPAFVATCKGLCGPRTRCLVAFERRSPEVRACFLEEARRAFPSVRQVSLSGLPAALRAEYVDLWELRTWT